MTEPLLVVSDLHAGYGRAEILRGVSLEVAAGEVVALLGRNGAGKSTTLKAVMGLIRPTAGRVRFAGAEIAGAEPFRICRLGVGWVPEDRRVFAPLTVAENLVVGARPARPDAPHWTATRLLALFPNLDERRNERAGRLSGGEQQMLAVARTLMGNPRLLLLDEPSEGLAPMIVAAMTGAIVEMRRAGLSVLVAEHSDAFARRVASRAVLIDRGVVRSAGAFDALGEAAS